MLLLHQSAEFNMNNLDAIIIELNKHPQVINSFTIEFNNALNARLKEAKSKRLKSTKLPSMEEYLNRKR